MSNEIEKINGDIVIYTADDGNTKIDELLKNEKVEWKKLGEVSEVGTGSSNTNEQIEDGEYPFYVRSKNIKRNNKYEFDEIAIVIPGEGGIGEVFHYVEGKYALHQRAYRIHIIDDKINSKFVYHYMLHIFKKYIMKNAVSATVSSIRKPMIENFEIPIPSIKIQEKTAETLDKFTEYVTELQAELQAELQDRTLQYNYYRDKLLSEEYLDRATRENCGEIEIVELGELCEILDNKRIPISKVKREKGIYPYYGCNGIQDWVKEYIFDGTYLLIGEDGSVLNSDNTPVLHYVSDKKFWVNNHAHVLDCNSQRAYLKYIYYFLSQTDISEFVRGVPPKLNQANLKAIKIILPKLDVQKEIIRILDKFQDILKDTEGLLPTEIEQRQKQYEYYREKLLTFNTEGKTIFTDRQTDRQTERQT